VVACRLVQLGRCWDREGVGLVAREEATMAEEEIVVQNPKLMEWMSQELLKGSFEGDADALAKYIIALLETVGPSVVSG